MPRYEKGHFRIIPKKGAKGKLPLESVLRKNRGFLNLLKKKGADKESDRQSHATFLLQ